MPEKFMDFPNVPWYKNIIKKEQNMQEVWNTYVVLIENNYTGRTYIEDITKNIVDRKSFVSIEEFTKKSFDEKIWNDIKKSFNEINIQSKKLGWFTLAEVCNQINKEKFLLFMDENISMFNYQKEIEKSKAIIGCKEFKNIENHFLKDEKYKILLGDYDFADSLFSSEWLFNNYMNNDCLDKTYVITCYIKSIEQLLTYVINRLGSDYKIRINIKGQYCEVSVISDGFYKVTLGNMIYFLKNFDNYDMYVKVDFNTIMAIVELINDWVQKERNGYFHKPNINQIKNISQIRSRTYLLYFLLLGSIK